MVPIWFIVALAILDAFGSSEAESPPSPSYPRSPCPRIFKYDANYINALNSGMNSSASILVEKPSSKAFKLEVFLQARGKVEGLHGEPMTSLLKLNLADHDVLQNKEVDDIEFRLDILPSKGLQIPHPYLIKANGKTICKGKQMKGAFSAVTLSLTGKVTSGAAPEPVYTPIGDY